MTHVHELRGEGEAVEMGYTQQRGIKEGGKWDNYNNIIFKIYFKKKGQTPRWPLISSR